MTASTTFLPARQASADERERLRDTALFCLLIGALAIAVACLFYGKELSVLRKVPSWIELPVVDVVNAAIGWVSVTFRGVFRFISGVLDWHIRAIQSGLSLVPWQALTAAAGLAVWRLAGWRLAVLTVSTCLYIVAMGYWQQSLNSLILVFFALPIACLFGMVAGVAAHAHRRLAHLVDTMLDFMQTVPAFAYLVPLIVLLGLGPVAGVVASILYAAPAMARNVRLGLDLTPRQAIEAALISGCTPAQVFFLVKLPSARRHMLIGLNQTIMATLSMVIFAAAIGGFEDIGWEVLRAARRAEFGYGIIAGIVITLLAVLLDRITAAISERQPVARNLSAWSHAGWSVVLVAGIWLVSAWAGWRLPATELRGAFAGILDHAVMALSVTLQPITDFIKGATTNFFLLPLRVGLAHSVTPATWGFKFSAPLVALYVVAFVALAVSVRKSRYASMLCLFVGLLLYTGFTGFPWAAFVLILSLFAARIGGIALAARTALGLMAIVVAGFWDSAMFSLYICSAAVIVCVVLGGVLGIAAGESDWFSRMMRPANDFLQTIPPFVILIPVIVFFQVGDFSSLLAIVAYAIAAMARYTEASLRSVPTTQVEAGRLAGCTRLQLIFMVKLPAANRQLLLGVSQTVMYALAMLAVAALVGARGLGQDVYVALGKADAGLGLLAGGCIALIAMTVDGAIKAYARAPA